MRNKLANKKTGVTLVEIMIVVAIIGLVAIIAIPNYLRSRQTADTTSLEQTARQIAQKMEQIFWGQNPNEYPPQTSMPSGLVVWAAPTNLGNIQDLLELLKKLCEQQGKLLSDAEATDLATNSDSLDIVLQACFNQNPPLTYTSPAGGQDYLFSIGSPTGTYTASPGGVARAPDECNVGGDCDDGIYCNGTETCQSGICQSGSAPCSAGNTCHESDQSCTEGICGNDIWEGSEECGEEGYNDCGYEFLQCSNCICEFIGCPEGYYFDPGTWQCFPTTHGCPSSTSWTPSSGCCDPCPTCPPFPRPTVPSCGQVGEVIPDAPTGPGGG